MITPPVNWGNPERPALVSEDGSVLTYGQLQKDVRFLAQKLVSRKLIFLLGRNDSTTIIAYLACLESGTVPLLLDPEISPESLNRLIEIYQPFYIFSPKKDYRLVSKYEVIELVKDYALHQKTIPKNFTPHAKLFVLLATSGSTGSQKLVRLSQNNILSNARSISEYLRIDVKERAITSLPFCYSYGLSVINSHLYAGASVVLTNRGLFDPLFWQLIKTHDVTNMAGVPYSYEILMKLRFERIDLPSLKTMTQAGGKMANRLTERISEICHSKNIRFYTMYGQTEASPRMAYLPAEYAREKLGSIGRAIPGGKLWLEDSQGSVISNPNEVGELIYSGANVALGYAEKLDDLQLGDEWQSILRTGDLARQDTQGFFYIEGRKSRFIKIFGVRFSLDSVEMWFAERGYIAAAYGSDDHMCVTIECDQDSVLVELEPIFSAAIKIHPSALDFSCLPKIPRLTSGKFDYSFLSDSCSKT